MSSPRATPLASPAVRRRRLQRNALALVVAVVLLLPEVVLARHALGDWEHGVTLASDALTVVAGLLAGVAVAGLFVHLRPWPRFALAVAAVVALVIGVAVFVLSNVVPPPLVLHEAPAGLPTANGVLNAIDIALLVGSGAAALRLTATYLLRRPPG